MYTSNCFLQSAFEFWKNAKFYVASHFSRPVITSILVFKCDALYEALQDTLNYGFATKSILNSKNISVIIPKLFLLNFICIDRMLNFNPNSQFFKVFLTIIINLFLCLKLLPSIFICLHRMLNLNCSSFFKISAYWHFSSSG